MKKSILIFLLIISLCALIFSSCCGSYFMTETQKAEVCMEQTYNNLIGLNEEEIIITLGAPQKIEKIDDLKIYHYYQSYGYRSRAIVRPYWNSYHTRIHPYWHGHRTVMVVQPCPPPASHIRTWEAYDEAQIIFKDGIAIRWTGNCQR